MAEHNIGYILSDQEADDLMKQLGGKWTQNELVDYGKFKVMRHTANEKFYYEIVANTETGECIKPEYSRVIGGMKYTDIGFVSCHINPPQLPRKLGSTKTFVQISEV
jgi:hypothetical protein